MSLTSHIAFIVIHIYSVLLNFQTSDSVTFSTPSFVCTYSSLVWGPILRLHSLLKYDMKLIADQSRPVLSAPASRPRCAKYLRNTLVDVAHHDDLVISLGYIVLPYANCIRPQRNTIAPGLRVHSLVPIPRFELVERGRGKRGIET
jgi:hypothetical protein